MLGQDRTVQRAIVKRRKKITSHCEDVNVSMASMRCDTDSDTDESSSSSDQDIEPSDSRESQLMCEFREWCQSKSMGEETYQVYEQRMLQQKKHRSEADQTARARKQWQDLPIKAQLPYLRTAFCLRKFDGPLAPYQGATLAREIKPSSRSYASDSDDSEEEREGDHDLSVDNSKSVALTARKRRR